LVGLKNIVRANRTLKHVNHTLKHVLAMLFFKSSGNCQLIRAYPRSGQYHGAGKLARRAYHRAPIRCPSLGILAGSRVCSAGQSDARSDFRYVVRERIERTVKALFSRGPTIQLITAFPNLFRPGALYK
jgi:hypothetical protein